MKDTDTRFIDRIPQQKLDKLTVALVDVTGTTLSLIYNGLLL